jgi:hypothetical protein
MTHSSLASLLDLELTPGEPPLVRADAGARDGTGAANWAAGHRNALPADLVPRFEREGWILDRAYRAQPGTLRGPARDARRAGRPGAAGRLLSRHQCIVITGTRAVAMWHCDGCKEAPENNMHDPRRECSHHALLF